MRSKIILFFLGQSGGLLSRTDFIGKRFFLKLLYAVFLSLVLQACESVAPEEGTGTLFLRFQPVSYMQTKAALQLPDTCDFILKVTGPDRNPVYEGKYGDAPERLMLSSGTYMISVRSSLFTKPEFSAPVFGDDQCVLVPAGGTGRAELKCRQVNCGIRLKTAQDFLTSYPQALLFVKSSEGKLMYGYSEKRIAYFNPGEISVLMEQGTESKLLFTRNLQGREILSVGISALSGGGEGGKKAIYISVDTSRIWNSESYIIGEEDQGKGDSRERAYSIAEAKKRTGERQKWVYGYAVGVFKSASKVVLEPPFPSSSNIALAGRRNVSDKGSCFPAELKKGDVRSDLNLVDNPSNLRRKIYLKGDIVSAYFGMAGMKNVTGYFME